MRFKVVSIVFPPDPVSTAQLVGELADDLVAMGHDVSVLTTQPHYGQSQGGEPRRAGRRLYESTEQRGVHVERVKMPHKARSKAGRVAQWAWFHAVVAVRTWSDASDAVLVVSPPTSLGLICARPRRRSRRVVLAVWELYPDILASLGVVAATSPLFALLRRLEGATYGACDHIAFISAPMRAAALRSNPSIENRSSVLPTFAAMDQLRPLARPTSLAGELGLRDEDFVVGYGGNLGPAQDLGTLLDAAGLLAESDPDIKFVLFGSGTESGDLRARARSMPTVLMPGQLPFERVPEMYSTFDLSVIALADGVAAEALPSKFVRSLACGCPVLAIASPDSPLAALVVHDRVGWTACAGNAEDIALAIRSAKTDPRRSEASANARRIALERFDRRKVVARYASVLEGEVS